jgi:zinc and cadmium transporter
MTDWLPPVAAALAVALVSLSGAFTLWIEPARLRSVIPFLVSLAVGVLLGDAFLHLIPDAAQEIGSLPTTCIFVLLGMLLFFTIEKVVRWQHRHDIFEPAAQQSKRAGARMNLVGDAVHNFTDGVLIAGSFAADPVLGVTTTAAIIVHEIPQEIGDVGALIQGGHAPRRALALNFMCSLSVVAGVIVTLIAGHWAAEILPYLLPIAAGGFIYIAAADFIPTLHAHGGLRHDSFQVAVLVLGIGCMFGVSTFERVVLGIG